VTVLERRHNNSSVTFYTISSHSLKSKKWMQSVGAGSSIIVSLLDDLVEDWNKTKVVKVITMFDSVANTPFLLGCVQGGRVQRLRPSL